MFWLCCFVFCLLVSCFCLSIFCVSSTSISNSAGNDLETLDKHLFLQHKNEILSKQKWTSKHRFSRVLGGRPGGRRLSTGGREANGERAWGWRVQKSKQKSGRTCAPSWTATVTGQMIWFGFGFLNQFGTLRVKNQQFPKTITTFCIMRPGYDRNRYETIN